MSLQLWLWPWWHWPKPPQLGPLSPQVHEVTARLDFSAGGVRSPESTQFSMGPGMSRSISGSPEWNPGARLWSEPLGAAWVGAEQHLVTGGGLGPATPLLTQELLEPVGGEGERLAAQLHQVSVLQPRVGQAVLQGGPAPARPRREW